jgi:hypothetical protein
VNRDVLKGVDAMASTERASSNAAAGASSNTAAGSTAARRIVGADRHVLAQDLVRRYMAGESIRSLATITGRSYGFIHRLLTEAGVPLRQRGGARRRKRYNTGGNVLQPGPRTVGGGGSPASQENSERPQLHTYLPKDPIESNRVMVLAVAGTMLDDTDDFPISSSIVRPTTVARLSRQRVVTVFSIASQVWAPSVLRVWLASSNSFLDGARPIDRLIEGHAAQVIAAIESEAAGVYR